MKFILASRSPRRKEILKKFGYDFISVESDFSETGNYDSPIATVTAFARGKAEKVFNSLSIEERKSCAVIGADTVVFLGDKILGKPATPKDAENMLNELSGKTHFVYTGYAVIYDGACVCGYDKTEVLFNVLSEKTVKDYVATGSPMDKAGSYGIQDGFDFVKNITGSTYNVIGFPIEKIKPVLDRLAAK